LVLNARQRLVPWLLLLVLMVLSCSKLATQPNPSVPHAAPAADVVGITNYLDVGFRMVSDLRGMEGSQMQLGASWQVGVGGRWGTVAGAWGSMAAVWRDGCAGSLTGQQELGLLKCGFSTPHCHS